MAVADISGAFCCPKSGLSKTKLSFHFHSLFRLLLPPLLLFLSLPSSSPPLSIFTTLVSPPSFTMSFHRDSNDPMKSPSNDKSFQESHNKAHPQNVSSSNASVYSDSTASTQSSSLFSRGNASTVPSSAYSNRSTKFAQQSNLLRIPDVDEYEPVDPAQQQRELLYQQQQQQQPYRTLSSSSSSSNLSTSSSSSSTSLPQSQSTFSSTPQAPQSSTVPASSISSSASRRQNIPTSSVPIPIPLSSSNAYFPQAYLPSIASPTPEILEPRISSESTRTFYSSSPSPTSSTFNSRSVSSSQGPAPSTATATPAQNQSTPVFRQFPPISRTSLSLSRSTPSLSPSSPPPPPLPPTIPTDIEQSQRTTLSIVNVLQRLAENLTSCQFRANNRQGGGLLRIALEIDQSMNQALTSASLQNVAKGTISVFTEPSLATIIRVSLHFIDNFLSEPSMSTRRAVLLRQLYDLGVLLKILDTNEGVVQQPRIFAMGAAPESIPGIDKLCTILELMTYQRSEATMDQDGAFIAPVLRGLDAAFAVPTYYFGYPKVLPDHRQSMISLSDSFGDDAHFFCAQNYIRAASLTSANTGGVQVQGAAGVAPAIHSASTTGDFNGFQAPFRVPRDYLAPPISMSISTDSANANVSGTFGGYIFPKVDPGREDLAAYSKSTYAVTCAHVILRGDDPYPKVTIPSAFMINYFRRLLVRERDRYALGTYEHSSYTKAIDEVQAKYYPSNSDAQLNSFGQVAWGERDIVDGQLSDVVIIRCNDNLKCRNNLGDDIPFTQYDPGLRFGYLDVKTVVRSPRPGMHIFKYGSTTKYTSGQLNGPKIVYWSEGKLQSSEFVVASGGPFASGGDSGAWILHKNTNDEFVDENVPTTSTDEHGNFDTYYGNDNVESAYPGPSLGVVGMLHSYDGERKEFGLYTPMTRILDRLEEVTGTAWGIVGIPEKGDEGTGMSDTSDDDVGSGFSEQT